MQFRAEEYFRAGTERMRQARSIHHAGESYALAMCCGGLAVECILRAFRWDRDPSFEGRHDLDSLLRTSRLLDIHEELMRKRGVPEADIVEYSLRLRAAMNEVVTLWHNNLRFAAETSLRAFLLRIDRLRGIKGDAIKKNCSDLLNAAQTLVDRGVTVWTSRKK